MNRPCVYTLECVGVHSNWNALPMHIHAFEYIGAVRPAVQGLLGSICL